MVSLCCKDCIILYIHEDYNLWKPVHFLYFRLKISNVLYFGNSMYLKKHHLKYFILVWIEQWQCLVIISCLLFVVDKYIVFKKRKNMIIILFLKNGLKLYLTLFTILQIKFCLHAYRHMYIHTLFFFSFFFFFFFTVTRNFLCWNKRRGASIFSPFHSVFGPVDWCWHYVADCLLWTWLNQCVINCWTSGLFYSPGCLPHVETAAVYQAKF